MNFPAELKYSKSHEWVKLLDDTTAMGTPFSSSQASSSSRPGFLGTGLRNVSTASWWNRSRMASAGQSGP